MKAPASDEACESAPKGEATMTVRSAKDVKLVVKPVFFAMEHKYYYEGPCRMSS